MIFALMGVYAKSALGLGLETECVAFLHATLPARHRAYDGFVASLVAFTIAFRMRRHTAPGACATLTCARCACAPVIALALKVREDDTWERRSLVGGTALVVALVYREWGGVMLKATEHIYKARVKAGLL